jgi:CDP-diacylglycerol--serine O-phosphatidyltransferase
MDSFMNDTPTFPPEHPKRRRGIYLLPNLFTTAALFSGFYAIVSGMNHSFEHAAIAIFVAMVLDGIDGRVARLTNTQSAFGAEYDSLSDLVSFGLAPALVMYSWTLSTLGKMGWLAAFIYTAATALRLARFNVQIGKIDKAYFQGLPSPAAAAVMAGLVWFCSENHIDPQKVTYVALLTTLCIGLLMVSNIRYRSFKDLNLKGKVPFFTIIAMVLIFAVISSSPSTVLFGSFVLYAFSGVFISSLQWFRRRRAKQANH